MTREIKFRGRSPLTKQWEYGFLITVDLSSEKLSKNLSAIIKENAWYEPSEGIGGFKLVEPETIGQFTGLKDKNGKEIYEGDILRIPPKNKYEEHTYNSFEVFYHDNDCTLTDCGLVIGRLKPHGNSAGGYSGYKLIPKHTSILEVIGNIHDNPELLEVSNA